MNRTITRETIEYLSKISEGSMRQAITYLEKIMSYSEEITIDTALDALGNYSYETLFRLVNSIIDGNEADIITILDSFYNAGNDLKLFVDTFLSFCLDVSKYSIFKNLNMTKIPSNMETQLQNSINFDNATQYYNYLLDRLLNLKQMLRNDSCVKDTITISFLQMARCQ